MRPIFNILSRESKKTQTLIQKHITFVTFVLSHLSAIDASEPTEVMLTEATKDAIEVHWNRPEQPRGRIRAYIIKYKETAESCSRENASQNCGGFKFYKVSKRSFNVDNDTNRVTKSFLCLVFLLQHWLL